MIESLLTRWLPNVDWQEIGYASLDTLNMLGGATLCTVLLGRPLQRPDVQQCRSTRLPVLQMPDTQVRRLYRSALRHPTSSEHIQFRHQPAFHRSLSVRCHS